MPISATGRRQRDVTSVRRDGEQGFTLVELMAVIAILGLASAAVVMAIPNQGGRVHDEAERLAARALAVRDDAIIQGRSTRLVIEPTGYAAERRTLGRWQAYAGRPFGRVALPDGIVATTGEAGRIVASFDATGAAEPVVVTLSKGSVTARVDIPANGAVRVAP